MRKQCSKCHEDKEADQFFANKGCNDGLGSWCKSCQGICNATYYKNNKSKYRERTQNHRKRTKAKIDAMKGKPCADCNNTYPPVCMDFDHVKGEKLFDIASYTKFSSSMKWQRIQDEIDKCELVCANCHRLRTEERSLPALV